MVAGKGVILRRSNAKDWRFGLPLLLRPFDAGKELRKLQVKGVGKGNDQLELGISFASFQLADPA